METKICKSCGKELPLDAFRVQRSGSRSHTCNECTVAKQRATIAKNRALKQTQPPKISQDTDFDGWQQVEVIQLMSRAKKWLEQRGCSITLRGTCTLVKELRF